MVSAMEAREGPIIHLSSVFMTNGRADTPWHSVLESCRFRVPAFDQRQHDLCGYCHLYMINMTWISNLEVYFQRWCWRLAYAFCYVGRLVFVARGRPCRTSCRASELSGGRGYPSRTPRKSRPLSLGRETSAHFVGHGGLQSLNTQDKGERLQRQKATYHPPGIPDEIACIPHQWAFQYKHRTF